MLGCHDCCSAELPKQFFSGSLPIAVARSTMGLTVSHSPYLSVTRRLPVGPFGLRRVMIAELSYGALLAVCIQAWSLSLRVSLPVSYCANRKGLQFTHTHSLPAHTVCFSTLRTFPGNQSFGGITSLPYPRGSGRLLQHQLGPRLSPLVQLSLCEAFPTCLFLLVAHHTARRAIESEFPDAYIRDDLAAGLCGKEALESARQVRGDPWCLGRLPTLQAPDPHARMRHRCLTASLPTMIVDGA